MHSFFVLIHHQLLGRSRRRLKTAQVSVIAALAAFTAVFCFVDWGGGLNLISKAIKTQLPELLPSHLQY